MITTVVKVIGAQGEAPFVRLTVSALAGQPFFGLAPELAMREVARG